MSRPSFFSPKKKSAKKKKYLPTMSAKESALIPLVKYLKDEYKYNHHNTEYTIEQYRKITLYYKKTLEVGQHHTMDPIMEGILSCSLASSRGHPPIELPLKYNTSLHVPLHCLNPFI
jgi:hypothetical protein